MINFRMEDRVGNAAFSHFFAHGTFVGFEPHNTDSLKLDVAETSSDTRVLYLENAQRRLGRILNRTRSEQTESAPPLDDPIPGYGRLLFEAHLAGLDLSSENGWKTLGIKRSRFIAIVQDRLRRQLKFGLDSFKWRQIHTMSPIVHDVKRDLERLKLIEGREVSLYEALGIDKNETDTSVIKDLFKQYSTLRWPSAFRKEFAEVVALFEPRPVVLKAAFEGVSNLHRHAFYGMQQIGTVLMPPIICTRTDLQGAKGLQWLRRYLRPREHAQYAFTLAT
jgi:hypothetical protein